jgi:3',5'-cyclic AMP phosphodiesterase CpdA
MPVFAVPGNHDDRAGFRAAFGECLPFGDGPSLNYEARIGDLRVLALDTLVAGKVHGALDCAQLDWLAEKLSTQLATPTVIAMHHPPFPSGVPTLDAMALTHGCDRLGELVAAYDGPLSIVAGHIHRPFQAIWNGAFCQVGGGPSFQHALDLRPEAPEPGSIDEPYAYFILRHDAQGTMTVHKRYVSL